MEPAPQARRAAGPAFALPVALDLRSNTVETVLQTVAELAVDSTLGGAAASVTLMKGNGASTFASTGPLATALDETQYEQGYGPCLDAVLASDAMDMRDATAETRWPKFTPVAIEHGVLCSFSLPIPVLESVAAGLNVYATRKDAFSETDRDTLRDLVGFAGAAIANMHLYESSKTLVEQMRTAAESRAVIDQARGILMAQHRCGPEEAFAILRTTSQRANRKIRDIATEIVRLASGH
jgi:GAF domain-containing protein